MMVAARNGSAGKRGRSDPFAGPLPELSDSAGETEGSGKQRGRTHFVMCAREESIKRPWSGRRDEYSSGKVRLTSLILDDRSGTYVTN